MIEISSYRKKTAGKRIEKQWMKIAQVSVAAVLAITLWSSGFFYSLLKIEELPLIGGMGEVNWAIQEKNVGLTDKLHDSLRIFQSFDNFDFRRDKNADEE